VKPEFVDLLKKTLPQLEVEALLNAITSTSPTVSVRLNRKKIERLGLSVSDVLLVEHEEIAHCRDGFFLKTRPMFTTDPSFHAGLYYVQEANSMWIGEIMRGLVPHLPSNALVLDMCAAPGGKTTHVSSVLRDGDLLVSNEIISQRNSILFENVSKWGDGNTFITKADAKVFSKSSVLFDVILCDAPCSGEGLFRKDDAAMNEWSLDNVDLCSQRQQRIVFDLYNNLKPGGYFIYSTCTYNRIENEDNVSKFCEELGFEVVNLGLGLDNHLYCLEKGMYRCMPHISSGEGLFFSVLKKPESSHANGQDVLDFHVKTHPPKNKKNTTKPAEIPLELVELFPETEFQLASKEGEFYGIRHSNKVWIQHLTKSLPGVVHPGFPIGTIMKNKWKPHVAAALLIESPLKIDRSLSDNELLMYLRREFIPHSNSSKEGITIVGFKIHGETPVILGVGNSVRNGINNLWPMEWRVRSIFQDTHRICG
jgi:16S rRNA (cytosine1407-C5)-methyltransferase